MYGGVSASRNLIGMNPRFVRSPSHGGDGWVDDPDTTDVDESANNDYGDLRLTAWSPAIESAANDLLPQDAWDSDGDGNEDETIPLDLKGDHRLFGALADCGAYEFQALMAPGRETPSLTVTSSTDIVDLYDGEISLREAIRYADSDTLGNAIAFDDTLDGSTITLSGAALWLEHPLTVNASSLSSLAIDGAGLSRVFLISASEGEEIELNALTITGGHGSQRGGGIYNRSSTLVVKNCTVFGNSAGIGGGVYNGCGSLEIVDSTVSGNTAFSGGGLFNYRGAATLVNSIVVNNSADDGGGIYNGSGARLEVRNSIISGNTAIDDDPFDPWQPPGIKMDVAPLWISEPCGRGGGIFSSPSATVNITNSTLSGNWASRWGGGIYSDGGDLLAITNSTLSGNSAIHQGGGVYVQGPSSNTQCNNTIVAGNTATDGPDIYHYQGSLSGEYNIIGVKSGQSAFAHARHGNHVGTSILPIDPAFVRRPSSGGDGWGDDLDTPDIDESANDDYGDLHLQPGNKAGLSLGPGP